MDDKWIWSKGILILSQNEHRLLECFIGKKNTFAKSSRQDDIICSNQQKFLLHKLTGYDRRNRGCIDLTQSITQQSDFVITTARVHLLCIYRGIF